MEPVIEFKALQQGFSMSNKAIQIQGRSIPLNLLVGVGVFLVCFFWAYWPTFAHLANRWAIDPQYSHGFLVPIFAIAMLWLRLDYLKKENAEVDLPFVGPLLNTEKGNNLLGIGFLVLAAVMRLLGAYLYFDWAEQLSLIPCLAGIVLLVGGFSIFRWALPAIAFLVFMIPLPYALQVAMGGPLQRIAATSCTFVLQTMGYPALAEGNVILLNDNRLEVAEACNGLSMMMVFFALAFAFAFIINRPWWEKTILVFSAVPIAIAANVIRITATGILFEIAGEEIAKQVLHDYAGLIVMMPVALVMLWFEMYLLSRLFVETEVSEKESRAAAKVGLSSAAAKDATKPAAQNEGKGKSKINEAAKAGLFSKP